MSVAGATVDTIRSAILDQLEGRNKRKLEIMGEGPEKYIKLGFVVGMSLGVLGMLLTIGSLKAFSMLFLFAGAAIGVILAHIAIGQAFSKWQDSLVAGIPVLVDFLPAFLQVQGITVRFALENTVPFLPEPLKTECGDAVDEIRRTGSAKTVLDALQHRIKNPIMSSICTTLSTAWDSAVDPDMFDGLKEEVENAREVAAARATTAAKGLFAVVVVIGLLGLVFLGGYPTAIWLQHTMSGTLGGPM